MANNSPIQPPVSQAAAPVNVMDADIFSLTPEQLQHRRNLLDLRRMEREESERSLSEGQAQAARKANADNMVLVHAQEVANQSACPHIKPRNGGHALAGQKTHRGYYTLVCQYCGKNFSVPAQRPEEQIPGHVQLDMSLIGGPHN